MHGLSLLEFVAVGLLILANAFFVAAEFCLLYTSADGWFPNSMVLEWDTIHSAYNADGLYTIQLEVANSSKTLLATSAPIGFVVDNSVPAVSYTHLDVYKRQVSHSRC